MSQFCTKVKTATFTNEETGDDFDISVGDYVTITGENEIETVQIEFIFTKNGEVILNCNEGFEVSPEEIVALNGRNL
jgi:hypothetical protein